MLESTVSDETLDGVFENVGEGHWLRICNDHYNRTPDLGKCMMWWNV